MYRLFLICSALVILCGSSLQSEASEAPIKVLCTTFPVYQIARNVVNDSENIDLQLMLPAAMGCPHDYALTPQDMKRLATAQVLIINGLGMEEFLGAPIKLANPDIIVIDSSKGITNTLDYINSDEAKHHEEGAEQHHEEAEQHHGEVTEHHDEEAEQHHEEAGHHHHHEGVNPHIFVSPLMVAKMSMNIAEGLAKADSANADKYVSNASKYAELLRKLNDDFVLVGKSLKNNRIIEPHGVFDYLARDMGLEIVAVLLPHGQEPAAAKMLEIVSIIKSMKPGAIFTEPQYSAKAANTIARETGLPVAELDPVASGPATAPIDYYQMVMRKNLDTITATLGVK